ncbi:DUF6134 family protein [Belliella marina]|uniref:DUF6134 family protein n=1 Tax=Belliella marina TaxID=1644146 RepID=A0ABW4VR42_9BACT
MKKYTLIPVVLIFVTFQTLLAQEQVDFDITVAGFSIGEMKATKTSKGEETFYELTSEVGFWFFGKVNVDYSINSHFKGDQLMEAQAKTKSNKGDFASDIQWDDEQYIVKATSYKYEKDTIINHPIHFSSAMLYFQEPKDHKLFMAENFGLPSVITKHKDYYEVSVNGNRNKFYYVDGKLEKAVMENPIKNYVIKRK